MTWRDLRSEATFFVIFFSVFMLFRTTAYGMYHIPSESMLPTLSVGDRITVNKFAYGYSRHSVPFSLAPKLDTPTGRIFSTLPQRGDIVVFKHPHNRDTMIKRLIGLPGDRIELRGGYLYVNDTLVPQKAVGLYQYQEHKGAIADVTQFHQTLPGGREHATLEREGSYWADNFGPIVVSENHFFALGDNRDNSLDSRFPDPGVGLVPIENLVGRAEWRAFSTNIKNADPGLETHESPWLTRLR